MGARGRKSSAELTLLQRAEEVLVVRRPDPPDHLADEARMEWREVVNSPPLITSPALRIPFLRRIAVMQLRRGGLTSSFVIWRLARARLWTTTSSW